MRLRSELLAAGLPWVLVSNSADLGQQATGKAPWALVFITSTAQGTAVDIALPSRGAGGTTARRLVQVGVSSALTPTELALRAVEVLRAHVAAGPLLPLPPAVQVEGKVNDEVAPVVPRAEVSLSLGASALTGRDGLGVGVGPAVGAAFVSPRGWGARLAAGSSLLGGNAEGGDVAAKISQWLMTAEAMLFMRQAGMVKPYFVAGAGAFCLQGQAEADARLLARSVSRWAAAAVAGVGISVGKKRLRLVAEAKLMVTVPKVTVQTVGPPAGTAGQPSLMGVVALSWTL